MNIKISRERWNELGIKTGWLNRIDTEKLEKLEQKKYRSRNKAKKIRVPKHLEYKYSDAITGLDV